MGARSIYVAQTQQEEIPKFGTRIEGMHSVFSRCRFYSTARSFIRIAFHSCISTIPYDLYQPFKITIFIFLSDKHFSRLLSRVLDILKNVGNSTFKVLMFLINCSCFNDENLSQGLHLFFFCFVPKVLCYFLAYLFYLI